MKAHIIENGVVVNTIVAAVEDAQAAFPDATCVDGAVGGIGWLWNGETLTAPAAPPPAIPEFVLMKNARKALVIGGVSMPSVDAAIANISNDTARTLAQIDWEFSDTVRRDSPLVASLAPALGLSSSDVDELFIAAGNMQ